jgi:hypothetical protein
MLCQEIYLYIERNARYVGLAYLVGDQSHSSNTPKNSGYIYNLRP